MVRTLLLAGVAMLAMPARADGFAVLPTAAADVRAADVDALDALDLALHKAAVVEVGAGVQDMATIRAHVAAASSLGVQCGGTDLECLKRLAVLANVDAVLAPVARRTPDGWEVGLTLLDVHKPPSARVNRVFTDPATLASDCRALVHAALTAPPAPAALADLADPAETTPLATTTTPAPTATATATQAPRAEVEGEVDGDDALVWWVVGGTVGAAALSAAVVAVVFIIDGGDAPEVPAPAAPTRGSAVVVLP